MPNTVGRGSVDDTAATTPSLLGAFERDVLLGTSIPDDELERATIQDVRRQVTLVAESDGAILGVGEYHAGRRGEEVEVAFAVADARHHEGVATVLLEVLALIAQAAGFLRLVAETQPTNMAVRSLRSILQPSHAVLIGAGRDATSPGRRILADLRASFTGRVSVVHPTVAVVGGIDAVSQPDQLGDVPDLAVAVDPVVELIHRIGMLAATTPEIRQLELSPVLVGPHGCAVVDAAISVAAPPSSVLPVRGLRA